MLLFSILFNNSNNSLQILPQKIVQISKSKNGREFRKYWKNKMIRNAQIYM